MSIQDILKSDDLDIRLTNKSKWLVWYNDTWTVFYNNRGSKILIQTDDIEEALQVLIKE